MNKNLQQELFLSAASDSAEAAVQWLLKAKELNQQGLSNSEEYFTMLQTAQRLFEQAGLKVHSAYRYRSKNDIFNGKNTNEQA